MQEKEFDFSKLSAVPTGAMKDITPNNLDEDITANTQSFNDAISSSSEGHLADFGKYNAQSQSSQNNGSFQPGTNIVAGSLITAEMAVNFVDILLPSVFVMLMKQGFNKVVSKNQFALTSQEKKTIEPVLQNYLNSINFTVDNPGNALLLTVAMIYGMKVIEVVNNVPSGKFTPGTPGAENVGALTQAGTIRSDGRGRPKGSKGKQKPQN